MTEEVRAHGDATWMRTASDVRGQQEVDECLGLVGRRVAGLPVAEDLP